MSTIATAQRMSCLNNLRELGMATQAYVAEHEYMRRPFYRVPHRPGVAGVAADFILHVSDLLDGRARGPARART